MEHERKDENKDRWIGVRFGPADYRRIKERAVTLGLSMGSYVRMTLLQALREGK